MTNKSIHFQMFTESKYLIDITTSCSNTEETRIMIDVQNVQKAYNLCQISNIGLVRFKNNPADAYTKVKGMLYCKI